MDMHTAVPIPIRADFGGDLDHALDSRNRHTRL